MIVAAPILRGILEVKAAKMKIPSFAATLCTFNHSGVVVNLVFTYN